MLRFQDYFIVNGKKYYTGTVFITKDIVKEVEAAFIYYDIDKSKYVYKIGNCTMHAHTKIFWNNFVSVTDKKDNKVHAPVIRKRNEFDIDGLFLGWVWYIFLMLISIIFNDAIGLWIFFSIVFFSWRHKKIKEEGTYVER